MAAPDYAPQGPLRYAEVYSADGAKIGSLARLQPQGSGIMQVDVGGFLTVYPDRLALNMLHVALLGDDDGVMLVRATQSTAACIALLQRQKTLHRQAPHLGKVVIRRWGTKGVQAVYARR